MMSEGLGALLLSGGMDNFTDADLSHAQLQGISLDGMIWSVWGTEWPPTFDVAQLRRYSQEIDPGSGVYRVEYRANATNNLPVMA